jgi:uncharacterized circularly permuted ATP-grasp superfamily protein
MAPFVRLRTVPRATWMDAGWSWPTAPRHPPGPGYVLENRIVLSRAFPSKPTVPPGAPAGPPLHAGAPLLQSLSGRDNPHIVLLTPGPFNETYFEHAYLSRYLGFTWPKAATSPSATRRSS